MFDVRLKAPKDKSLVAEVHSPISVETAELIQHGEECRRYFAPAGGKVEFQMGPGDDIYVGEFDPEYKSLEKLVKAENRKREQETQQARAREAVMPELRAIDGFGEGTYEGEAD